MAIENLPLAFSAGGLFGAFLQNHSTSSRLALSAAQSALTAQSPAAPQPAGGAQPVPLAPNEGIVVELGSSSPSSGERANELASLMAALARRSAPAANADPLSGPIFHAAGDDAPNAPSPMANPAVGELVEELLSLDASSPGRSSSIDIDPAMARFMQSISGRFQALQTPAAAGPVFLQAGPALGGWLPQGRHLSSPVVSALRDFRAALDQLAELDGEEAKRLGALLELLMALAPDEADKVAARFTSFVHRLLNLQGMIQNSGGPPAAPQAPAPAPAPRQTASFRLTVEVQVSERVEQVVARLEEHGVSVQRTTIESTQTVRLDLTIGAQPAQSADPLALDLDGDGIELSSPAQGQPFDINADGRDEQTAFVRGGDAFLAVDQDGNGRIDSGRELFGDQDGFANGFAKLSAFDANRDAVIDPSDPVFDRLRLLKDLNGDGQVAADETVSLSAAGVKSICLSYKSAQAIDTYGNTASEVSSFEMEDGRCGRLVDVKVGYLPS